MKAIQLTQGQFATVDDSDYDWLNQWKWHAHWNKCTRSFYARRHSAYSACPKRKTLFMHREILGLSYGDPRIGDHKDASQTLNNSRSNLRIATRAQNTQNQRAYQAKRVHLKGVSATKNGKFYARIRIDGKLVCLGTRSTPEGAHALYRDAALEHFGEFARTA